MLSDSIPIIRQAAGMISDEALAVPGAMDDFSRRFYLTCKEIASEVQS